MGRRTESTRIMVGYLSQLLTYSVYSNLALHKIFLFSHNFETNSYY